MIESGPNTAQALAAGNQLTPWPGPRHQSIYAARTRHIAGIG